MVEPKLKTDPNDTRKLREIASLDGAADEILAEFMAMSAGTSAARATSGENENFDYKMPAQLYTPVKILSSDEPAPSAPASGMEFLSEALMHQAASDSLMDLAVGARSKVRESDDPNDRWVWQKQIMVWEKKSHDEEVLANALFAKIEGEASLAQQASPVNSPESVAPVRVAGEPGSQPEITPVSGGEIDPYIRRFDILGASPYSDSNPIPTDVTLPEGVFYRIQLGAYGSPVPHDAFGGISPITAETLKDRGLIKYYAGKFTKYEDASLALSRVRSGGYEDAFVTAWYNRKPISTQKAKQLE
jgi:hypothetical protein